MYAPPNYPGVLNNQGAPFGSQFDAPINTFAQYTHQTNKRHEEKFKTAAPGLPSKRTVDPIVTGTSVLGIRYNGGVMITADTLGSYGSLARFKSLERVKKLGEYTAIGASGEYSDFQTLMVTLEQLLDKDFEEDDGIVKSPREIYNYISQVMYHRRNQMDPFYNQLVVAGYKDGKSLLGYIDLHGTSYEDDTIATGYGAYIARPLLRKAYKPNLTKEEAKKILEDCMRVMYYRDARSINKLQMCDVSEKGVEISAPYSVESHWAHLEPLSRKHQIVENPN